MWASVEHVAIISSKLSGGVCVSSTFTSLIVRNFLTPVDTEQTEEIILILSYSCSFVPERTRNRGAYAVVYKPN
jgi:hypothetical protein